MLNPKLMRLLGKKKLRMSKYDQVGKLITIKIYPKMYQEKIENYIKKKVVNIVFMGNDECIRISEVSYWLRKGRGEREILNLSNDLMNMRKFNLLLILRSLFSDFATLNDLGDIWPKENTILRQWWK